MSISLSLPLSLSIAPPTNSPSASTASASAQISDSTSLSPTSQQPSSRPASSAPPASSDAPPTQSSAPPPTSSAPETTPSSAAQSSTVLTTPSMTVSQTTVIATSNGQTITSVVQITSTIEAGATVVASSSDTGHRSSNTGAIVGGVVGGLAVLGLAVGALLWYRRRQKRGDEFDGDFDPARVGGRNSTLGPEMMQADDGMGGRMPISGGIITPFAYAPTVSAYDASSRSQSPPMPRGSPPPLSQYSQDGVPYTPTMSSTGGYYAAVPQQAQAVGGYYPHTAPSSTSGSSAYGPRSAKEREAMSGSPSHVRAFSVANPGPSNEAGAYDENQIQAYLRSGPRRASQGDYPPMVSPHSPVASSSSGSGVGSGVIVHQDGGRVQENIQEADEIPPTYDSIPNDHEPRK
ncbi:hypothetical protein MKEN_01289900 [Mycena kentingensis (nom. inval.)]|nr:hypothetical protein MKEN_01289900 [Mycena kentingensis (nom. inval.)]